MASGYAGGGAPGMASKDRGGSRSPRRRAGGAGEAEAPLWGDTEETLREQDMLPLGADLGRREGDEGPPENPEKSFKSKLSMQRAYLQQVLQGPPIGAPEPEVPKELAAGLPLEAAKALMLLGPPGGPPWRSLPAHVACLAAALRLFGRLLPGRDELACESLCAACLDGSSPLGTLPGSVGEAVDAFTQAAAAHGLTASAVPSATESLQAMVRSHPTACCIFLEGYVGVQEDPDSGEELEQEVGASCLLVVGGELLGPSYIAFDPWGLAAGEVSYWASHSVHQAAPAAWIELTPEPAPEPSAA